MKKTFAMSIFMICCVFALSACRITSYESKQPIYENKQPHIPTTEINEVFAPNEIFAPNAAPTDRNADLFWAHISDLGESMCDYFSARREQITVFNCSPDYIVDEYGFNAFAIKTETEGTSYCEYYNGKLYGLNYSMSDYAGQENVNFHGYVHFAIADLNRDGHGEVYTSYIAYRPQGKAPFCHTTVFAYDSKPDKMQHYIEYKRTVYFKEDTNGKLQAYKTDVDSYEKQPITSANTISDPLNVNTTKYDHVPSFEAECGSFRATVTFDDSDSDFAVMLGSSQIKFKVTVSMTYLGESFDYIHGDGYKAGAVVHLFNEDSEILCDGWAAPAVMSHFFVEKGEVITRTYTYSCAYSDMHDVGTSDAVVSYRGESAPVVKNVLSVTR